MFANRRKRVEQNKIVYYQNKLAYELSPHQGIVPELLEETLWKSNGTNIYNTNIDNVGIGVENPLWKVDVSGSLNVTSKIMINSISIAPPVGSVMAYIVSSIPDGWLICNGSAVSRAIYAGLFHAIGVTFGLGDATTTFNLPDYRGAFLRGTGKNGGTGIYEGLAVDISQNHATQTHTHTASSTVTDPQHTHTATSTVTDPGHNHTQTSINDDFNGSGGATSGTIPSFPPSDSAGSRTWTNINSRGTGITVATTAANSSTGVTVATTVANSTGSINANETRPYNFGVFWIIKY